MLTFQLKTRIRIWRHVLTLFKNDLTYLFSSSKRKLPDFLIIGTQKGGTTSMFEYINEHPEIQMARRKEIYFYTKYYHLGMSYYRSFFPKKNVKKLTGEATPYYFFHPLAPARIKKTLPNVKIILLLRDPILRAYSHYNMTKEMHPSHSFDEAINYVEQKHLNGGKKLVIKPFDYNIEPAEFNYISGGLYFKQLANWLKYFQLKDMLILKSEDLFENPKKELKKVYDYLGLSEIYPQDISPKNAREYSGLSKEDYDRYKLYFTEDQKKLHELLGDHFQWFDYE